MIPLRDFDSPCKFGNECYAGIVRVFLNPRRSWRCFLMCRKAGNSNSSSLHPFLLSSPKSSFTAAQRISVAKKLSDEKLSDFRSYQEDPLVDKLRSQLGFIHPIPSPPINRSIVSFFVLFFLIGVVFDKLWTSRRPRKPAPAAGAGRWTQAPTSFSMFLEKDLQRKESVEWVNMVLGKLWKVYRPAIENWIMGLLQPVIDDLRKPGYVERVEIKQFSLGDEPLSVRNVERRTSRRSNDLQ